MKATTRVLFLLTALFLAPYAAIAADLWVASGGSDTGNNCQSNINPCLTIQQAVDQAGNNDTIGISIGTYAENITIDKAISGLTIRGSYTCAGGVCSNYQDPSLTVIDGAAGGAVVAVNRNHAGAGTIRFEYLTIQNGDDTNAGGGLAVIGGYGSPSRITVANSIIAGNTTTKYGGGAAVLGSDVTLEIVDSTIRNNSAQRGGGVSAQCLPYGADVHLVIRKSLIQSNEASGDGGGIYAESHTTACTMRVTLESNIIGHENVIDPFTAPAPNNASYGGGLCLSAAQSGVVEVVVADNTINANTTRSGGGGITSTSSDSGKVKGQLTGNLLIWNSSIFGSGAVALRSNLSGTQSLLFADNSVSLNDGRPAGVGVEAWSGAQIDFDMRRNWMFWNGNDTIESVLEFDGKDAGTKVNARLIGNSIAANASGVNITASDSALVEVYMQNTYVVNHLDTDGVRVAAFGYAPDPIGGTAKLISINNTIANNGTGPTLSRPGLSIISADAGATAHVELTNTIVWGNGSADIYMVEDHASADAATFLSAYHCDIGVIKNEAAPSDGTYSDLGQNISQNPLFVDPGALNYEISAGPPLSPAANAGICDRSIPLSYFKKRIAPFLDFEGDPRPPSPTLAFLCDMGADEIDHCADNTQNFDESGLDCGGSRCAPCGCVSAQHVERICPPAGDLFADIASAYAGLTASGECDISSHRMEFRGVHAFTHKSSDGGAIAVKLSGGWNCAMTSRAPGDHTTINGKVVIGGDTRIEADGLGIR